jgi:hypothetical protein
MIDWVMPPETAVALYIYWLGGLAPQGILLHLHNSTRTRGPLVRPVRPTG